VGGTNTNSADGEIKEVKKDSSALSNKDTFMEFHQNHLPYRYGTSKVNVILVANCFQIMQKPFFQTLFKK